jgi:hypothetical protein
MPGGPDRPGHLVVQRGPDQRVPEFQPLARFGQHPDGACLVDGRYQVRDAAPQHDGQVGHGEVNAQQGRGAQHHTHRAGHEPQPVRDRRRQRAWCRIARQLGRARFGHGQASGTGQRGDQLGEVQRVARRSLRQPQQPVVGPSARHRRDQGGHRRVG